MADRPLNQLSTVYADVPGSGTGPVTLSILDPNGATIASSVVATFVGGDRFRSTFLPLRAGIYTLVWTGAVRTITQQISVGIQPIAGMTKFDVRIQTAQQVAAVWHGIVTDVQDTQFVDNSLIGGADEFVEWWLMMGIEHPDAGITKRVIDYNGAAMILNEPFDNEPVRGDSYVLFSIDPKEIDRAVATAVSDLSEITRIPVEITGLVLDADDIFVLPAGITHIATIYDGNDVLQPKDWSLLTGRRIKLLSEPDDTVKVIGLRHASFPIWEDSIIETDPTATILKAAHILHSTRALGQALDFEEHLRRQLAAEQAADRATRNAVGRLLPGTREVLP